MAAAEHGVVAAYSTALFEAAKKADALDAIYDQSRMLDAAIAENHKFHDFLWAPNIPRDAKEAVFLKVFGKDGHDLFKNFVRMLIRRGRLEILSGVVADFHERVLLHRGIKGARVTTAAEMSGEWRSKLEEALNKFTGYTLQIDWRVEPKVIGGVRFQMGDMLLDTTLSSGLEKLRHRLERVRVY